MNFQPLQRKNRPVKTVNVEELKSHINFMLAGDYTQEEKRIMCHVLENVLFSTKQYNGFNYSTWILRGGYQQWKADGEPSDNSAYIGKEYDRFYY